MVIDVVNSYAELLTHCVLSSHLRTLTIIGHPLSGRFSPTQTGQTKLVLPPSFGNVYVIRNLVGDVW